MGANLIEAEEQQQDWHPGAGATLNKFATNRITMQSNDCSVEGVGVLDTGVLQTL